MDNSQEGVVDCKILMILITFCSGDTGFLKCVMTGTGFVVGELQQIRIEGCGDQRTHQTEMSAKYQLQMSQTQQNKAMAAWAVLIGCQLILFLLLFCF